MIILILAVAWYLLLGYAFIKCYLHWRHAQKKALLSDYRQRAREKRKAAETEALRKEMPAIKERRKAEQKIQQQENYKARQRIKEEVKEEMKAKQREIKAMKIKPSPEIKKKKKD